MNLFKKHINQLYHSLQWVNAYLQNFISLSYDNLGNLNKQLIGQIKLQRQNLKIMHPQQKKDIAQKLHQYEEAITYLNQALQIDPENKSPLNLLGECLYSIKFNIFIQSQRKYKEALIYYQMAYKANKKSLKSRINIGKCLQQLCYNLMIFEETQYKEALQWINSGLEAFQQNTQKLKQDQKYENLLILQGKCLQIIISLLILRNMEKYNEAIDSLNKAIAINSTNSESFSEKGKYYFLLQDYVQIDDNYEGALVELTKALDLNSKHFDSLVAKGQCLSSHNFQIQFIKEIKRYQEAQSYLDQALNIQPNHLVAISEKGQCLLSFLYKLINLRHMNKISEAIQYIDKALEIDKNHCVSLSEKGQCLYSFDIKLIIRLLGDYLQAIEFHDRAIKLDEKQIVSQSDKGQCLFKKKQLCIQQDYQEDIEKQDQISIKHLILIIPILSLYQKKVNAYYYFFCL